MAEIPLRTYLEQLDNLVERKQPDEVVAHCRHILGAYPKHLDTYRMLGKALLEKGRHGDAADIFQRVLSVLPDDFISHVGMSIVREDEANLDAAIWHMERAFEAAPANGAIQQELCRLYGRRDGVVPSKARLTRGALARMYAQGGLYLQAEAELKVALAADADRIDLMTKLADVYWQTDQPAQAAQTSAAILQKLPYSIDANRILVNVFRAQGRPNDAAVYRQRLEALDPYEAFADPAANGDGAARVDPAKVMVPRMDYVPGMEDSGSPDWLASIGAKFEEPAAARASEAQPDWLASASESAMAAPAAEYQPGQGSVPDWLKDLDSGPGAQPQSTGSPEWLKEMEAATSPLGAAPSDSAEGLPDWLVTATGPLPADAVPDWMLQGAPNEAMSSAEAGTAPLPVADDVGTAPLEVDEAMGPTPAATAELPAGEVPDWLQNTVSDETDEDLPDWLKAITAQPMPAAETPTAQAAIPSAQIPDWLKGAAPDASPAQAPSAASGGVPGWLQTAASTPSDTSPLPDWLQVATGALDLSQVPSSENELSITAPAGAATDATAAPAGAEAPTANRPVEAAAPTAKGAETPAPEGPSDWLKGAALAGETIAAARPAAPTADSESIAATQLPEAGTLAPTKAMADEIKSAAPTTASVPPAATVEPQASVEPEAELMAASTLAAPSEQSAPASTSGAELPDWLQAATAVPAQDETPVWLKTAPAGPSLVAAQAGDEPELEMPDWLTEAAAGAPPADVTAQVVAPPSMPSPVELPDYLQLASPEAIARAESPLELEPAEGSEDAEPAALPAVIPDWLQALAPSPDPTVKAVEQAAPVAAEASAVAETADSLSWLDELTAGDLSTAPASEPAADELPAWLASPEATAPEAAGALPGGLGQDTLAPEIPPWAQNEEPGPSDTIASWLAGKHVPDWLRQPAEEAPSVPSVEWEPDAAVAPAGVDSLTALAAQPGLEAQPEPAVPAEAESVAPGPESMDPDEAFRWLESLAAHQGARSEELFTTPEVTSAAMGALSTEPAAAAETTPEPFTAELATTQGSAMAAPTTPAVEQLTLATETPTPPAPAPVEPGSLEEFLRQTEATMPVDHLAGTAPSKAAQPSAAAAEQPAMPAELDTEAAMRWLEGLAAQQGANPEELLTTPEERTVEAPQWVAAEQAAADATLAAAEPAEMASGAVAHIAAPEPSPALDTLEAPAIPAPVELAPADRVAVTAEPTAQPAEATGLPVAAAPAMAAATVPSAAEAPALDEDSEAAMRWLEGLAVKQGANPDELLTAPDERTLEVPSWVAAQAAEAFASEATAPESAPGLAGVETEPAATAEAAPAGAPTATPEQPEWLKAFAPAEEPAEPTPSASSAGVAAVPAEPEPAAAPETPEWLKAFAPTEKPIEAAAAALAAELPALAQPAAPVEPTEPAVTAAAASSPVGPDLDKLSRLSERLAAARRAREAEMETRFAEQRSQQEAARRWVEERLEGKRPEQGPATGTRPLVAPPESIAIPAAPPPAVEQPAPAEAEAKILSTETAAPLSASVTPTPPAPGPARQRQPRPRYAIRVRRPAPAVISPAPTPAAPTPTAATARMAPDEALARGQSALSGQDYDAAVEHLSGLVEQNQHLESVVKSLEGAVSGGRAPVPVLRLLGDAYVRDDQLQKALDTYRQALSRL